MSGGILNYRYIAQGFFESSKTNTGIVKQGDLIPLEKSFTPICP